MPIKPPTPRHSSHQTDEGLRIILPSKKNFLLIFWYGLWLIMWIFMTGSITFFLTFFILSAIKENNSGMWIFAMFITFMLLFLLGIGLPAIYQFFWQLTGKEIISINSAIMSVTKQIFGWKKVYEYGIMDMKDLRASTPQQDLFARVKILQYSKQNGMIAFDYGAKTFRFGLDIDEAEAKQIISEIQEKLAKQKTG